MSLSPTQPLDTQPIATSKWGALAVVLTGIVMATLDTTIVNVALPDIAGDFDTTVAHVAWVVIGYSLAMSILVIPFGRLSEQIGFRRLYLIGFLTFTVGSALCAIAPTLELLVLARVLQSAGGAATLGIGGAVISLSFPANQRGRALGAVPIAVAIGISSGPVLGGFLTEHLSWHWVFWVNIPIGILAMILTMAVMHRHKASDRWWAKTNWRSIFFLSLVCMAFILGTNLPLEGERGWDDPLVIVLLVVTVPLGMLFVRMDGRSKRPLVPYADMRNPKLSLNILVGGLSVTMVYSNIYLINWHMQRLQGFSPATSGQILLTSPICLSLLGPISGWICDRFGAAVPKYAGILLAFAGTAYLSLLTPEDTASANILGLALFASGMGLFQTPNNHVVYSNVARERVSQVSSFNAASRIFGGTMGTVVTTTVLGTCLAIFLGGQAPDVKELVPSPESSRAFQITFQVLSSIPVLMLILTLLADRRGSKRVAPLAGVVPIE